MKKFEDYFLLKQRIQYQWILPLSVFAAAIMIIGVSHETPFDEDFCYAWTVRHLLDTGEYRLHDWAAPNIRFQAFWGALFVKLSGGFFSGLRLSSITLCGIALAAFYRLALCSNLSNKSAVAATVSLVACPFFLAYSVCFVSDGPFLALALISLYIYSYAWKLNSLKLMCTASIVTCAAVLTRQTGVAIVGALLGVWLLSGNARRKWPLVLCGIFLPIFAVIWSALDPAASNNLGSSLVKVLQAEYLSNPAKVIGEQIWKLSMIATYVAALLFPLSIVASITVVIRLIRLRNRLFSSKTGKRWIYSVCISSAIIFYGIYYHKLILHKSLIPPYLPWYWDLLYGGILNANIYIRIILSPLLFVIASLTGAILVMEIRRQCRAWRHLQFDWLFSFTFLALCQLLIFYKLGDKYVLLMIPFAILVLIRWSSPLINYWWKTFLCICLVVILVQALYLGSVLRLGAVQWQEAERLRESGIPVAAISTDWQWISYYRYNDFAEAEWKRGDLGNTQARFFSEWLPAQRSQALYRVVIDNRNDYLPPDGWQLVRKTDVFSLQIKQVVFLPLSFEPLAVLTLKKMTSSLSEKFTD